jgi:hypothetical protein
MKVTCSNKYENLYLAGISQYLIGHCWIKVCTLYTHKCEMISDLLPKRNLVYCLFIISNWSVEQDMAAWPIC